MTQEADLARIVRKAGPYPLEAYHFVREGLTFTSQRLHGDPEALPEVERHISGPELCLGLRDFAIDRYGMLAPVVLEHWKVRRTDDFGRIVFAMIEAGFMSKTDDDTAEDFCAVFDFDEAFSRDSLLACLDSRSRCP